MKRKALVSSIVLVVSMIAFAGNAIAAEKGVPQAKSDSYKIGSGDILRITTWKEADFTLENILVRTDGKISFPLLNDVQAAGLTPLMLKDVIENGLKAYVTDPVVTVTVVNPASQAFYILGEVVRTGEYPLVKDLSVLQAFALAGGFTEWADKDEIILIRREAGKRMVYRIDYQELAEGKNLDQNLLIMANDTIIVP